MLTASPLVNATTLFRRIAGCCTRSCFFKLTLTSLRIRKLRGLVLVELLERVLDLGDLSLKLLELGIAIGIASPLCI